GARVRWDAGLHLQRSRACRVRSPRLQLSGIHECGADHARSGQRRPFADQSLSRLADAIRRYHLGEQEYPILGRASGVARAEGRLLPPYPAAHACNAGACATILKAFFDADYVLPHPVEAMADGSALEPWRGAGLTLGNEIDKLASNIALGRDAAGVHYRSDSVRGRLVV